MNIKSWDDGKSWTFKRFRDPADLYYTTDGSRLIKETWTIRARQIDFHIVCCYTHFKDDSLTRSSQCEKLRDMTPRPKLVCVAEYAKSQVSDGARRNNLNSKSLYKL